MSRKLRRVAGWAAAAEIVIAPVVALCLLFPTQAPTLTAGGLIVLLGVWLARWMALSHPLHRTPLDGVLLLLLATVPPAVWASTDQELTTAALAYLLAGVILFGAIAHWTRAAGRAWWVWGGLLGLGLGLVALAPLGMQVTSSKLFPLPALYTRWSGRLPETINANVMAGALVLLWPLSLVGLQFRDQSSAPGLRLLILTRLVRIGAALSTLALLATLALTQSRGAYLGASVSGLVLLTLRWPRAARVVLPLALVLALVGASLVGWSTLADELTTGDATSGLDQRVEVWSRALYAIQDFPYTGLGLGTFERVVAVLYPLFLHPDGTLPHAHNLYLQVAADLGLPGLVAYLALLGLTFAIALSAYRVFRRSGRSDLALLCAGCIAGLAGMCVHELVDAVTWGTKLAFVPWVVMGLVAGLTHVAMPPPTAPGNERDTGSVVDFGTR